MTVPVPVISSAGITLPTYNDCLTGFEDGYLGIYGYDTILDVDDLDLQWIAIIAQAYFDLTQMIGVIYNSFSIFGAQGPFLDNLVALFNVQRQQNTNSTCTVTLTGIAGSVINNGSVGDNQNLGTIWDLPTSVTIPSGGTINVTATCTTGGAIAAAANTLTVILTPTAGWQSANNIGAAIVGNTQQTDAALIQTQQNSVALSSNAAIDAVYAAILEVPGVADATYFNNATSGTVDGIPANTVAFIVEGGLAAAVAQAIASKLPPGIGTYGTTSVVVLDQQGQPQTINFYEVQLVEIQVQVTITPLTGYMSNTGATLVSNIINFINNNYQIGENSYLARLYTPANNGGTGIGATYVVTSIEQCVKGGTLAASDLTAALYQQYYVNASDVTLIT